MPPRKPERTTPPKISPPDHIKNVSKKKAPITIHAGITDPIDPERLDAALDESIRRVTAEMSDTIWAAATEMVLRVGRMYLKEELLKTEEKRDV